jgi:AraC-like DNA-binding protein
VEQRGNRRLPLRTLGSAPCATVRVGPLAAIPGILRELDSHPKPVFDSVGLNIGDFSDPDTEISYLLGSRLLARCVSATNCEHFGLLVGVRASPSSLGVAGFMLSSAPDVTTALHGLVQHLDLHDQGGVLALHVEDDIALLSYAIHEPGAQATDQIYDLAVAVACNILRGLCGQRWNATEVFLSRRPPRDLAPYRRFFRAPLHFNAVQSGLAFPSRWLNHELVSADPLLHRHLAHEALTLHALRNASLVEAVRRTLRRRLGSHCCTATDVARELHMHRRTLSRKLQEQGTSFRQELDTVRLAVAQQLLADSTLSVARIATLLDYADIPAFSRAFKRWTGMSPAQWRSHHDASE